MEEKDYKQFYKKFWTNASSPMHFHSSDAGYDLYAEEVIYYLGKNKTVLDTACGSGEILSRIAGHEKEIVGVDYSSQIIQYAQALLEKKQISNVHLICADVLHIKPHVQDKRFNVIYNNQLIQYLTKNEIDNFIQISKTLLEKDGTIILLNIPNRALKYLYLIDFFKQKGFMSIYKIHYKYMRACFYLFRKHLKNNTDRTGIGFWYTMNEIEYIAQKNTMDIQFRYSMFPPYGYRFHAILKPI